MKPGTPRACIIWIWAFFKYFSLMLLICISSIKLFCLPGSLSVQGNCFPLCHPYKGKKKFADNTWMRKDASLPRTGMSHRANNKLLPKWQWSFTIPTTHISLIIYVIKDGGRVIGYDLIHYVMRKRQKGPCPLPEPVRAISWRTWQSHPATMWCYHGRAKAKHSCDVNSDVVSVLSVNLASYTHQSPLTWWRWRTISVQSVGGELSFPPTCISR